jgi:transcriptional regulator with PAS, ATPase and Fis domain
VLAGLDERRLRTADVARRIRSAPRPILGEHGSIEALRREVALLAGRRDICVLVHGETGVGKDLVAQALHELDGSSGPFVELNCAAISPSLFESEVFGHEAGSFTGAAGAKPGILELADLGTVFLDELGDLPGPLQPKLLRVLEQRSFRRVGGTRPRSFDARIISATNQPIDVVGGGSVRADLYYRLAGHVIEVPPLRDRGDDVVLLAQHFVEQTCARHGRPPASLAPQTLTVLRAHAWPGNLRELQSVMEHAVVAAIDGVIRPVHLPARILGGASRRGPASGVATIAPLHQVEREHLARAIAHFGGNLAAAARALELSRTTLRERLRRHGLIPESSRSPRVAADARRPPPKSGRSDA